MSIEEEKSNVDHPEHYLKNTGHEVIDVIKAWKLDFCLGNAIKYIARAGKKDPRKTIEDLNKAIWYIQWYIQRDINDELTKSAKSISKNYHNKKNKIV